MVSLPKAQFVIPIGHVVSSKVWRKTRVRLLPESLRNLIALDSHRGHSTLNAGRRKNLLRIENQVVFFGGDAAHLFCVDELCDLQAEQIHEALYRQVDSFHVLRMQADSSVRSGCQRPCSLERNISLPMQCSFDHKSISFALDDEVLDGRVRGREYALVELASESVLMAI
jgi:hypothetical protein